MVDNTLLLLWTGAGMGITVVRWFYFYRGASNLAKAERNPGRWLRFGTLNSTLQGLVWGSSALLFLPQLPPEYALIVSIPAIGLCAGASVSASFWPPIYFGFSTPVLVLYASHYLLQGSVVGMMLALMSVMFLIMLSGVTRNMHRNYRENLILRLRNESLLLALRDEKELVERSSRAKTRFLASASHDLRQPVHSLTLFSNVLEEEIQSVRGRQVLSYMDKALEALTQLLSSLLDISKLDAGVIEPKISVFNVNTVIDAVFTEQLQQASQQGLTLLKDDCDQLIESDQVLLGNILRNLVGNAIRFTKSGTVLLRCKRRNERLVIQVWDSGPGIHVDERKRIFEEFHQLHNPERDRSKGLGLGLAICSRLAILLKHPLRLSSRLGRGSVFSIEVPIVKADLAASMTEKDAALPSNVLSGKVVMLIDDELTVRQATEAVLQRWGCRVLSVDDIQPALDLAASVNNEMDIIISDYRLRENKTGVDAIKALISQAGFAIPALLVTGDTDPRRIHEAKQSGYILLHKPIKPGQFRNVLNGLASEQLEAV